MCPARLYPQGRGLHLLGSDTVYSDYSGYSTVLAKDPLGEGISEWDCEVIQGGYTVVGVAQSNCNKHGCLGQNGQAWGYHGYYGKVSSPLPPPPSPSLPPSPTLQEQQQQQQQQHKRPS